MKNCKCDHCGCDDEKKEISSEEKLARLKDAIKDLGYEVDESEEGEIRIK